MRRLFLAIAGLLAALAAALLLALRSEPFVLGAARWLVSTFSDFRLELRNPSVDFYRGTLSADEIHLLPADSEGPALLSVLDLSARLPPGIALGGDRAGSFLRAHAIAVYVSDSDSAEDPQPMQWLGYLGWLPAQLRVEQIHLVTAAASTWIFPLKQVRGDRLDGSNYRLTAQADYQGEPLGATVDLLAVDKGWGVTAAQMKIELLAPASGSQISLAGTVEGTADDFRYTFALSAYYRDIREFLKGFESAGEFAGELRLQGTMAGDTTGFVLSDATFLLINTPEYAFQASGRLAYQRSGTSSIELTALGELASLSYLVDWIDLDISDFGRARSSIKLSGSLDRPVIDEFHLTTSNAEGLAISMSGQLNLFEADAASGPGSNAIALALEGPNLGVLRRWLGTLPFEPGPWRARGQLSGQQTNLSLQDIVLELGTPDTLELRGRGAVGRISRPQGATGQYEFGEILLAVEAHCPDSARIGTLLGRADIPPHLALSAAVTVSGTGEELRLSDGKVTVTGSDLQASLGPLQAVLRPSQTTPLAALAGPFIIELGDTSALSQYSKRYRDRPIPALGPVKLSGRLAQKGEMFQLLDLAGAVGAGDPTFQATGRVGNLASFDDVLLQSKINGLDTHLLLGLLLPDFAYPKPLGALTGSFTLSSKKGAWRLSQLALASGDAATPLSFSIAGDIANLTGLASANLDSQFALSDPALLEAMGGPALAPISGSLAVVSSPEEIHGTAQAQLGKTHISGDGRAAIEAGRIRDLQLRLQTPQLYLQDLGLARQPESEPGPDPAQDLTAEQAQENTARNTTGAPDQAAALLAKLRQNTPSFGLDIALDIGGIRGETSSIDSLEVKLSGSDKRFTLAQFSASYNQALAELRGVIDLNPQPPVMSLAGQATALPLGAMLADVGVNANVTGALTILGGVTMMGSSADALISSLSGSVALALEDAVIDGAAYDLLATDLLAWIYSGALTEKSTNLDCTMAKFELRQGVATTDSLYIESARMVATGKAKFDLVRRKMDLRITPLSKSRLLQVPSEVRLKGDMSSPRADVSPVSAVADAASSALMLVPNLTLKLFGVNLGANNKNRPCQAELGN